MTATEKQIFHEILTGRGQAYDYERYSRLRNKQAIRTEVHVDSSYPEQSRLRTQVFTMVGWKDVATLPGTAIAKVDIVSAYCASDADKMASGRKIADRLEAIALEVIPGV